jgi:hypothetical protein
MAQTACRDYITGEALGKRLSFSCEMASPAQGGTALAAAAIDVRANLVENLAGKILPGSSGIVNQDALHV